jgi:hypothetical protein
MHTQYVGDVCRCVGQGTIAHPYDSCFELSNDIQAVHLSIELAVSIIPQGVICLGTTEVARCKTHF